MHEGQVKIKKEHSSSDVVCCSDGDYYPYGTSISIDDDLVDELSADNFAVGDLVEVRAYAFVDGKSESSSKEGVNKSVRLQLTSMKLSRETDDEVKQLYGE